MADLPWEKYQQGPWAKYAAPVSPDPLKSDTLDTAIIGGASAAEGLNEGLNPLKILQGLAMLGGGLAKHIMPGGDLVTRMAEPTMKAVGDASKYTQPVNVIKGAAGALNMPLPNVPLTEEEAYAATGAQKTPLREGIAGAARTAGRALPLVALPGGMATLGASSVLGGVGNVIGGPTGEAIGAVLGGSTAFPKVTRPSGVTAQQLFDKAKQLHRAADNSPPITSGQMTALDRNIESFLKDTRKTGSEFPAYDPGEHTGTAAAIAAIKEYASKEAPVTRPPTTLFRDVDPLYPPVYRDVTMPEFFTLRDRVREGFNGAKPKDRKLLSAVLDRLESIMPAEVKAGDNAFRAASRSEAITELQKLADRSPTEPASALRTSLRGLLNSKSRMRFFSESEAARLDEIIADSTFNILRRAGAYAPSRGPVSLLADTGVGAFAGAAGSAKEGAIVAGTLAAGGEFARRAAAIRLRSMLKDFAEEIRNGRTAPDYRLPLRGAIGAEQSGRVE